MKKINFFLKKKWKLILLSVILFVTNAFFHLCILLGGSIPLYTLCCFIVSSIFILSIIKKFYKSFFLFTLILLLIEIVILLIPFPQCSFTSKFPLYDCKCSGIKKQMFGGSQCIGKIKTCYGYNYNKETGIQKHEVSCDDFPNNTYRFK